MNRLPHVLLQELVGYGKAMDHNTLAFSTFPLAESNFELEILQSPFATQARGWQKLGKRLIYLPTDAMAILDPLIRAARNLPDHITLCGNHLPYTTCLDPSSKINSIYDFSW